jgi:phospholipid/cholesterol/gamma-HCH transport system substrate-binding protein
MKNSLETRLGVFVFLAFLAGFFIIETIGGFDAFKSYHVLRAQFNSVQELKVGDPVKMSGVPVGRVTKLEIVNEKVEVTLRLKKGTPVKTDSKAMVKFAGLLGANYVAISFGSPSSPMHEQDSLVATIEQPDLNSLMARLDEAASGVQNLTKSFSGDKIDNILGPFTDFMRQNNPRLTAIIGNFKAVSDQIASGEGTVGKLIYDHKLYDNANDVVANLQEASGQIKGTISQAKDIMDQVNAGQGTIGKLIKDPKLYSETTAAMSNMKEILQKINGGQGTVGKLVNDQEFYKNAKLSLQKLDKATESLEDTGPLSILGSLATTLL